MAGQGRTLLILGGVLAAAIGAVVWFAVSGDDPGAGEKAADTAPSEKPATTNAGLIPAGQRARKQGTAGVFGEIRRTSGRAPVAGQEVLLAPERGEPYSVTTDAEGAFRFEKIPHGGPYELSAAAKGCGTIRIPGIALDRNENRNIGTLFLDPAMKLTVLVRDNMDQPVEGALVEAFPTAQWVDWDWTKALAQLGQAPISTARVTTDARGEALFPEIAVGRWTFTARKEGFATGGVRWVTIRSDQEPKPTTIWLSPGHPLDGRVLSADKKPVEGALVMAGAPGTGWDTASAPLRARTTTDAEGRYAFASLESGETMLWVGRGSTPPAQVATVVVPRVPHFDIQLPGTGRLTGSVTSQPDGKPVEGATVRAQSWEDGTTRIGEAVTDAEGRYSMEYAAGSVNRLGAEKAGLVTVRDAARQGNQQRIAMIHEGETVTRDLRMRAASRLSGVVKGPGGPLPGARVMVYFGSQNEGFQQKSATAGADGVYEFASLDAGTVMVTASKEGHWLEGEPANWWEALQSADSAKELKVELTEGGAATRDIELKAGSGVEGVVLGPDGNPLAGVRVSGPSSMENPPTGADGAFRLAGVKPGSAVSLWASKEGFRQAVAKPVVVLAGETTTGVTIRMLNQAHVRGKVTTASGGPLVEARVQLAQKNPGQNNPWEEQNRWQSATRVPVKPDGTYDAPMPYAAPNQLLVRASALDLATTDAAPVELVDGREIYEVDIVLPDGADLAGRVVAKGGDTGIAGARVSVAVARSESAMVYGWTGGQVTVWAITDATGAFSVSHLGAGTFELRAAADGYVTEVMTTKAGADKPVVVELAPELSIEGVVAFADGTPVEGVEVQASSAQSQRTFGGMIQGPRTSVTDKAGAFRVSGLGAGTWALDVRPPWNSDVNIRAKRVDGIAGGAKDVRVIVEAGGTIAGRVSDAQGKGIGNAWINANPMPKEGVQLTGQEYRYAQSRPDGTFTLSGLAEGPYQVNVNAATSGRNYRPVKSDNVAVGTKDLRFTMEMGLSITGVINDEGGRPVAQLQVQAMPVDSQGGQAQGANAMTDQEGHFTLSGLAAGDYRLEVPQWGGPNQAWVLDGKTTYPAGTADLRLTVGKGVTISGVLLDDSGAGITQGWVSATTKKGGNPKYSQPKSDGVWEIAGLESGERYTLTAQAQGRVNATVEDVAAGSKDVKIVLAKGLEASGHLVDAAGKAMAAAQIMFTHTDGKHSQWTQTQADGRFTVAGLVEGTYEAKVWQQTADGRGGDYKAAGTIKSGDRDTELRLQ
jgi:5-hydroxyisourate hydrolase-like protein (transthyretin family)